MTPLGSNVRLPFLGRALSDSNSSASIALRSASPAFDLAMYDQMPIYPPLLVPEMLEISTHD